MPDERFEGNSPLGPDRWCDVVPYGWIPTAIGDRYSFVRWIYAGSSGLSEPMFNWSVGMLRMLEPPSDEFETSSDFLIKAASRCEPTAPKAIVIHITRCGSTLVMNALKTSDKIVGIAESPAIDGAIRLARASSNHWRAKGRELLRALVTVYARYQGLPAKQVVIKCGVFGPSNLALLRSVWPDVPFLILIRNPIDVIVSNLKKLPQWMVDDTVARAIFRKNPPVQIQSDRRAFCAWAIGQFCSDILRGLDCGCTVVDYEDVTPTNVRRIAQKFDLTMSPESDKEFSDCFRVYSKLRAGSLRLTLVQWPPPARRS